MNYENIRNNIVKVFPCKSQTSWGRNTFQREVPAWLQELIEKDNEIQTQYVVDSLLKSNGMKREGQ